MNYTITKNTQFNSIEISFEGKPSEEIRTALKGLRFRWHNVKKVWYGYATEEAVKAAIEGKEVAPAVKASVSNKFGVKVGDIFRTSWGYEQTNNNFFQVIALAGATSVRVREIDLPMTASRSVSWASEDREFAIDPSVVYPASRYSVFIKDQEKGDIKRLRSFASDGVSNPQFTLSSYADAWLCKEDTIKVYESWYA